MRSDAKSRPHGDFAPAAVWVEGHLGAARFLWMTCIEWAVEPAAATFDIAYPVSWRRVTHLEGALRVGECISAQGDLPDKPLPLSMRIVHTLTLPAKFRPQS